MRLTTKDLVYEETIKARWNNNNLITIEDLVIPIVTTSKIVKLEIYLKDFNIYSNIEIERQRVTMGDFLTIQFNEGKILSIT